MREIFLHVGLPRTGTTFLQRNVFPKLNLNYTNLIKHGFFPTDGKNLLSDENLCGRPQSPSTLDRKMMLLGLHEMYPDAKVIVCFREQEAFFKSLYTVFVKTGFSGTFREAKKIMIMKYHYPEIKKFLNKTFDDVFEYQFEDFVRDKKGTITEMCNFMGVDVPQYKDELINPRWNDRQLKLCRVLNKIIEAKKFDSRQGFYTNKDFVNLLSDNKITKGGVRWKL